MEIALSRGNITFVKRPGKAAAAEVVVDDEDDSSEAEDEVVVSDEDDYSDDGEKFFDEEPDHEEKTGKKKDAGKDIMDGWKRDDEFGFDQRAKFNRGNRIWTFFSIIRRPRGHVAVSQYSQKEGC